MFQLITSFLLTGFFISLTAEGSRGSAGSREPNVTRSLDGLDLSIQKIHAAGLIQGNNFAKKECRNELSNILNSGRYLRGLQRSGALENPSEMPAYTNRANNELESQLQSCIEKIKAKIASKERPVSGEKWYDQYLAEKKYEKDFERYPQLERQFKAKIERTYQALKNDFLTGLEMSRHQARASPDNVDESTREIIFYTTSHPHLRDPKLVDDYNKLLAELIKRSQCTQEKIKSCHESLLKQVAEDSKSGLKGYCNKALREGQVCCSNPNKSCGDFAFAKEISKSFARSTPALLQTFAQLRGIQGRAEEACKLSALGSVVTPLGNLQIDSCNQAIEGCRETCDSRLAKFKNDFKKCYRIQQGETIRDIIKKAGEGFEDEDPKKPCQEQIAEVAEAYKQLSIDNSYNLSEESDHAEVVACRGAIGRYAPGSGGMGPAEQLAVNMCYGQINPTAQTVTPPGPGNIPYTPPTEVAGFAGTMPNKDFPALSPTPEEGEPRAPGMEEEEDFLPAGPEKPTGSQTGFVPSGGSSPGSGSGPGGSGGPSGGSDNNDKGARALAGLKPGGNSGDFAFQAGMEGEEGDNNSWKEGDDFGPQIEKDRKKAEDLKKLPLKYLSDEERDLLRAFTPPGKNESIFDFHSFMFHWFCRNYGCSGYFKAMGIPEDMRREIEEPKKFTKKKEG